MEIIMVVVILVNDGGADMGLDRSYGCVHHAVHITAKY
jgi:hypothetical protein